jgi:hypothetical protein
VKAWQVLGTARTPDGTELRLTQRDDEYVILADGRPLMSSRMHGSEEALATLACRHLPAGHRARVLVGGLGMGFTLRALLDALPPDAIVTVAELVPGVVKWNREVLGPLAAFPLNDPRVRIQIEDVGFTLRANPGRFDVVLLDVDNGPAAFTDGANCGLYDNAGVAAAHAMRRRHQGFDVEAKPVPARLKRRGTKHTIFLACKRLPGDPPRSDGGSLHRGAATRTGTGQEAG